MSLVPSPTGSAKLREGVVERHLVKGRRMGVVGRVHRRLADREASRTKGEAIVTYGSAKDQEVGGIMLV